MALGRMQSVTKTSINYSLDGIHLFLNSNSLAGKSTHFIQSFPDHTVWNGLLCSDFALLTHYALPCFLKDWAVFGIIPHYVFAYIFLHLSPMRPQHRQGCSPSCSLNISQCPEQSLAHRRDLIILYERNN